MILFQHSTEAPRNPACICGGGIGAVHVPSSVEGLRGTAMFCPVCRGPVRAPKRDVVPASPAHRCDTLEDLLALI